MLLIYTKVTVLRNLTAGRSELYNISNLVVLPAIHDPLPLLFRDISLIMSFCKYTFLVLPDQGIHLANTPNNALESVLGEPRPLAPPKEIGQLPTIAIEEKACFR